ncbi:phosphinothricin acetyltransferase [Neofusicoccum parvum]|uniref:Phosphinothricin acetyltransferase n=1 Tax=Neofusicoccum parvum TaxID=310453 RepID=A0ACB5S8E0_9PEZI|nr:phosphinothricin acetyltransferase [Neofusicoccum parvum]
MGHDRGPRKQNLSQGKPRRQDKWVTNKEIRERAMQNGKEPEGAWGSNASDGGIQSNPDDDPNHDIKKLVDWEGKWLPGPTDWESRRSYHHHNFNEEMMRFVNGSIDKEAAVDIYNEPTFLDHANGEVAPRVWASLSVEGTSLQEWWNNHVGSSLADLDSKAWWRSYSSLESSLLVPHEVPVAKIDTEDEEAKILHLHDLGSGHASDKLMERRSKRKAAKERRNAEQRQYDVAAVASTEPIKPEELSVLKPTVSLYIRPALAADAHQIAGIYNHYIRHSIRSPEIDPLSAQSLSHRIADETSNAMPWLVACKKGKKNGRGYTNGTDATILGFACASDYLSRRSAFGFAAEAEVYVHHNYLRQKIGSCLMDRLLYVLDPFYSLMDGYQFIGTGPFAEHGGIRVIGSAIIHVSFDKSDSNDIKAITSFLGKFRFKKEGELANIGVKQEKNVSLAIFRYRTGSTIDPKSALVA